MCANSPEQLIQPTGVLNQRPTDNCWG